MRLGGGSFARHVRNLYVYDGSYHGRHILDDFGSCLYPVERLNNRCDIWRVKPRTTIKQSFSVQRATGHESRIRATNDEIALLEVFDMTKDICKNHLIAVPDPNVSIVKKVRIFPVEVVVRGYITGSTDTSAWFNYEKGVRDFCGVKLPEGLKKNQKFETPIITPTTKAEDHDEKISAAEIEAKALCRKINGKKSFYLDRSMTTKGQKTHEEIND